MHILEWLKIWARCLKDGGGGNAGIDIHFLRTCHNCTDELGFHAIWWDWIKTFISGLGDNFFILPSI